MGEVELYKACEEAHRILYHTRNWDSQKRLNLIKIGFSESESDHIIASYVCDKLREPKILNKNKKKKRKTKKP